MVLAGKPTAPNWRELEDAAWKACGQAHVHGPTRVGAAVLSTQGGVFAGCNVEHRFRSHDVHAEVNALTTMVTAGHREANSLLIVSARARFTPCGACLDWVFELGGPECLIAFQRSEGTAIEPLRADEFMPYYPY